MTAVHFVSDSLSIMCSLPFISLHIAHSNSRIQLGGGRERKKEKERQRERERVRKYKEREGERERERRREMHMSNIEPHCWSVVRYLPLIQ